MIYAIILRQGVYYFAIQKKTKFVPLFKITRANGTSPEEFHKLIEQIEIKTKHHAKDSKINTKKV
jgi:hypothetical protein